MWNVPINCVLLFICPQLTARCHTISTLQCLSIGGWVLRISNRISVAEPGVFEDGGYCCEGVGSGGSGITICIICSSHGSTVSGTIMMLNQLMQLNTTHSTKLTTLNLHFTKHTHIDLPTKNLHIQASHNTLTKLQNTQPCTTKHYQGPYANTIYLHHQ